MAIARRDSAAPQNSAECLAMLAALAPDLGVEAAGQDCDGAFPSGGIAILHAAGLLTAPLRRALGGLGWGSAPEGAGPLATALRRLGRASLPLGRIWEGHVNALRLVQSHGAPLQARRAARDAAAGLAFGVWNTAPREGPPLVIGEDGRLAGGKVLCSGAGFLPRAIVTAIEAARPEAPPRMVLLSLAPGERADLSGWTASGMRASATGAVDLTGMAVTPEMLIGGPGDYAREPDFSAGAWRFAAVQCGGVEAVVGLLRDHHRLTGRGGDPHQAMRFGEAALAARTARLWVEEAARQAEAEDADADAIAFVRLARTAVERAALQAMELAQRSVGLTAFLRPHPLDRVCRDLATYLRQPAPDHALTAAAAHVLAAAEEPGEMWPPATGREPR